MARCQGRSRAVHCDAGNAVHRSRRSIAHVQRKDVSQSRRSDGTRQHRLSASWPKLLWQECLCLSGSCSRSSYLPVDCAKTPLGRHVYAVGGNERAARLAGIQVPRVKIFTYLASSLCAALVGLIIASQLEAAHPATGESFELNAIAAVVLGGTSLMGGRGSIPGSLIGAFVIGVLSDGLVMLGVSEFWQMVIKGSVIVLAVAVDQLQSRLQARFLPYLQAQMQKEPSDAALRVRFRGGAAAF